MSQQVRIRTAGDLLEALRGPDQAVVLAAHRAIRKDPARAAAFGAHGGVDVIDGLMAQSAQHDDILSRVALETLSLFDDPRVVGFFVETLCVRHGHVMDAALGYLLAHRDKVERASIQRALMQDDSRRRVRAAARLLAPAVADDPPEVALRLALADARAPLPPFEGPSRARYIAELGGILRNEAQASIERLTTFDEVMSLRQRLPAAAAEWLLRWGARVAPEACIPLLIEAFDDAALLPVALDCVEASEVLRRAAAGPLERVAMEGRRDHRLRAIRLGAGDTARLRHEADAELRATLVARAVVDTEALVAALADPDWRVRAAASERLTTCPEAREPLRVAARSERVEVAAAAVQALAGLGDDLWLEEALLTP